MKRIRLAICIGDCEYQNRLADCLMKHYREQLELHLYENWEQIREQRESCDIWLFGDCEEALEENWEEPFVYLSEGDSMKEYRDGICVTEKYQEVSSIVDLIFEQIPEEVCPVDEAGSISGKTDVVAVYSLSENDYQLPFGVTLGSILGEQKRVLLVDMQENSGFTQVIGESGVLGLEEILVMAENENFSKKRISSCIGHGIGIDYIYPLNDYECLSEAERDTCLRMLGMLRADMGYEVVILNLGSRFAGFSEVLEQCDRIYLLQRMGGICKWRESEFMDELGRRGLDRVAEHLIRVEIPPMNYPVASFERLVEQWKWNEMGDRIRSIHPQVGSHG